MRDERLAEFRIPRVVGHGCSFEESGGMLLEPLSPHVIEAMGAGNGFPDAEEADTCGDWTRHYRVWTNHGNMIGQNKNTGHISIARAAEADAVHFQVRQIIVNQDGMFQRLEAQIRCHADFPGAVIGWETKVVCYDTAQCPIDGLSLEVSGTVADSEAILTVNGVNEVQPLRGPLLSQWLILDTIQRGRQEVGEFTVLEHGLKLKSGHRLIPSTPPRPESTVASGVLELTIQRGRGLLPWEYWQDQAGRVLYAFSGTMMVILDDEAPAKTDRLIEELVQGGHHYEY